MEIDQESIPFIFIGIIILTGNAFVCTLYHQHAVLHTVANRFVISFAACDMMIALLFIPLYIFKSNLSSYVAALSSFGSILNLLALTYERYVAIFRALRYHEILNSKKIRLLMAEVWLSTLIITLFPLPWEISLSPQAYMKWRKVYSGILTGIITAIISITMFVYVRIFKVNRYHRKKEREFARFAIQHSRNERQKKSKESSGCAEIPLRRQDPTRKKAMTENGGSISNSIFTDTSFFDGWIIDQEKDRQGKGTSKNGSKNIRCCGAVGEHCKRAPKTEDDEIGSSNVREETREGNKYGGGNQDNHLVDLPNGMTPDRAPGSKGNGSGMAKASDDRLSSYQRFQTARRIIREIKAARIIATVFTFNCLCWLPIIIINFCDVTSPTGLATYISQSFIKFSLYLFVLNSMINPFIYALFKKDFRKVMSRRLRLLKQRFA